MSPCIWCDPVQHEPGTAGCTCRVCDATRHGSPLKVVAAANNCSNQHIINTLLKHGSMPGPVGRPRKSRRYTGAPLLALLLALAACGPLQARGHGSIGGARRKATVQRPSERTWRYPAPGDYVVHADHVREGFDVDSAAVVGATTTTIVLPLPLSGPGGVAYRAVLRWGWRVSFEPVPVAARAKGGGR